MKDRVKGGPLSTVSGRIRKETQGFVVEAHGLQDMLPIVGSQPIACDNRPEKCMPPRAP